MWLNGQCERLLPVPCFLITFTLREQLRALCRSHQKLFYEILFDESHATFKVRRWFMFVAEKAPVSRSAHRRRLSRLQLYLGEFGNSD